MDTLGVYNAIIERLTLNTLYVVAFTYYLALKLLTPFRVGVVHGSQVEAHCCYLLALKGQLDARQKTNTIKGSGSSTLVSSPDLKGSAPPEASLVLVGADLRRQYPRLSEAP